MTISEALTQYLEHGNYFDPEYGRENEVLNSFKKDNPVLSVPHAQELIAILEEPDDDWKRKYFVADLLYLYKSLPSQLLSPMLTTAVNYEDPSFNRIFLKPCLNAFGKQLVLANLKDQFQHNPNRVERLAYHGVDISSLKRFVTAKEKQYSLFRSLQNVWIRILFSLFCGGFASEMLFMVTGNPTRERTEPNLSLLYALVIFIVLTIVIKRKQKNAN